jgi:hypothetical protein
LAYYEGYKKGYYAGRKSRARKWSAPKAESARKFPMSVRCHGRNYQVKDDDELGDLLQNLIEGRLALANRYRVASTPRSRWPQPSATSGTERK